MDLTNKKYKNIGIHALTTIFTIDKGVIKVLLVKRKNEPFKDMWSLVGGAMYNDELIEECAIREIKEKTNIENPEIKRIQVFDDIDRSPLQRMICFSYVCMIDREKANILKETTKTSDAKWFTLDEIPPLAYDHNKILDFSREKLKKLIITSNILKQLYPNGFTIPEIQKVYETVLDKKLDRRNFRKKLLSTKLITDTEEKQTFAGKKPAKLYKFNDIVENKIIL
jgi:8-oxo-dGTP diphosphatase